MSSQQALPILILVASGVGAGCAIPNQSQQASLDVYGALRFEPRERDDDTGLESLLAEPALQLAPLVEAVLARNPSVNRARQAWRAALAAEPQATSFADPTIGVSVAPLSVIDPDARIGFGVELKQPLPYPGKRRLRGEVAAAEAEATQEEYAALRQRLALMTAQLYWDYEFAQQALAINDEHLDLLGEYGKTVASYLDVGRARQDEALEVDQELAELRRDRATLEANRDLVIARLDALLHRPPQAPLPAPPDATVPAKLDASRESLQRAALAGRPELRAANHRIDGAGASIELARRDYYPDLTVMGSYSRMWPMLAHQVMIGIAIPLPLQRRSRGAAVDAARAHVAQRRADRDEMADQVLLDVELAFRRVGEADQAITLYREQVLPAARDRVAAIRIGLDAGRASFLEVIRAERALRAARLRYQIALADAHRRRAELDWAIGRLPGAADAPAPGGGR